MIEYPYRYSSSRGAQHDPTLWASPLPDMLPLENPTVIFISSTESNDAIAADAVALHTPPLRQSGWIIKMIVLGVPTVGWIYFTWGVIGGSIWVLLLVWLLARAIRRGRGDVERARAAYSASMPPGTVQSIRFDSDAFELQTGEGHHLRVRYQHITALRVGSKAVVVGIAKRPRSQVYPRELFPDHAIEAIRNIAPALNGGPVPATHPPLPPTAPLTDPTAVFIMKEGTARRLARARRRDNTNGYLMLALVFGTPYLAALALIRSHEAFWRTVLALVAFSIVVAITRTFTARKFATAKTFHMPPGTRLSTRFGPDAFDINLGNERDRIPYDHLTPIRIRHGAVLLGQRNPLILPLELFPPHTLDYMRAYNKHK
ncbi:hypothetical protein [Nocardia sp. NPDC004722]